MKEAQPSVLEPYLGPSEFANQRRARRHRPAADAGRHATSSSAGCTWTPGSTASARLLRPPAQGLEGLGGDRADGPEGHGDLRQALRLDARPRPRPQRRPDRDRLLPRERRRLRPRDPRVLLRLRRPERARLQRAARGGGLRPDRGPDRPLSTGVAFVLCASGSATCGCPSPSARPRGPSGASRSNCGGSATTRTRPSAAPPRSRPKPAATCSWDASNCEAYGCAITARSPTSETSS